MQIKQNTTQPRQHFNQIGKALLRHPQAAGHENWHGHFRPASLPTAHRLFSSPLFMPLYRVTTYFQRWGNASKIAEVFSSFYTGLKMELPKRSSAQAYCTLKRIRCVQVCGGCIHTILVASTDESTRPRLGNKRNRNG